MDPYNLWSSEIDAARMLENAVSFYVAVNLDPEKKTPSEQRHFFLDREEDAAAQLGELYSQLRLHCADGGRAMLRAARQSYEIATASEEVFKGSIFGRFLLRFAPSNHRPHVSSFLKWLRPLVQSDSQLLRDLYFSSLADVGRSINRFNNDDRRDALRALSEEWDYFRSSRRRAPVTMAQILCQVEPDRWPYFLIAVCEEKWPADRDRPLGTRAEFTKATQNLLVRVSAATVAEHLWKLNDFISENSRRGELLVEATFSSAYEDQNALDARPFSLFPPDRPDVPQSLAEWSISRRGSVDREVFPLHQPSVARPRSTYHLMQALLSIGALLLPLVA